MGAIHVSVRVAPRWPWGSHLLKFYIIIMTFTTWIPPPPPSLWVFLVSSCMTLNDKLRATHATTKFSRILISLNRAYIRSGLNDELDTSHVSSQVESYQVETEEAGLIGVNLMTPSSNDVKRAGWKQNKKVYYKSHAKWFGCATNVQVFTKQNAGVEEILLSFNWVAQDGWQSKPILTRAEQRCVNEKKTSQGETEHWVHVLGTKCPSASMKTDKNINC